MHTQSRAITEFQAYQRTMHFNIFDSGDERKRGRVEGCVGQCRNKKFESQLTSNILSPIPGNNGPFDRLALSSRGCFSFYLSSLLFLFLFEALSFDFYDPRFETLVQLVSCLSRDVVWKSSRLTSRRLNIFAFTQKLVWR